MNSSIGAVSLRALIAGALMICFSMFQHTVIPFLLPSWMIPDFLFMTFLFVASRKPVLEALFLAMTLGYLAGLFSGVGGKYVMVSWGVLALILPMASQGVYLKHFFPCAGYVGLLFLLERLLNIFILSLLNLNVLDKWWRLLLMLPLTVVTAFSGPVLFRILRKIPQLSEEETTAPRSTMILWRGR